MKKGKKKMGIAILVSVFFGWSAYTIIKAFLVYRYGRFRKWRK